MTSKAKVVISRAHISHCGACVLLLVILTALLAEVGSAAAQGRIVARHGDWQTRCERPVGAPSEQCALVQNVEAQDRTNVGLTVIFLRTADRQARILRVLAPLGVLLPSGLGLSIDGNEVGLAGFVRCLQEGCIAEVELDDGLIERFQAGQTATFVIFQTPEAGIGIPISLNGFAEGFAALDEPPPPPREDAEVAAPEPAEPVTAATQTLDVPVAVETTQSFTVPPDDRTALDRLLEDDLLPYVAGAVGVVVLLIVGLAVLAIRGGRRNRRGEARRAAPRPAGQRDRRLAGEAPRRQVVTSGGSPAEEELSSGPRPARPQPRPADDQR